MKIKKRLTYTQTAILIPIGFYCVLLFIQFTDYMKNYVLFIRAKKNLITQYKQGASVAEMDEAADIVDYLQTMSLESLRQVFFTTATAFFIAIGICIILWVVKRIDR